MSLTKRLLAACCCGVFALCLLPLSATAQQRATPIDDVIENIRRALNDLRYTEAVRLARDLETDAARMRPSREVVYRQIFALAYFPEELEFQKPDSSLRQLRRLVQLRPDIEIEPELRWAGLDSLLAIARAETFAVGVDAAREMELAGASPTGDVTVFTTRPTRLRLALVHRTSGRTIVHDSAVVSGRGTLRLRAHDGVVAWITAGEYSLRVSGTDVRSRDTVTVSRALVAKAGPLALTPLPVLDSARLQKEHEQPNRVRTAVTGIAFGVLTSSLATTPRGGGLLARFYDPDPRAAGLGGVVALGSVAAAFLEKGRAVPAAIAANQTVRRSHADAVARTMSGNARVLSGYRVTVRITEEMP
jgi:hypothetical protein